MKLAVCVLLCLGAALAEYRGWTNDPSVIGQIMEEQKEFRYGREMKYIYNGQVMTGIPGTSKQHSGSRIKAIVKFVCKNEETCIMKIEQIRTGKLNRHVKTPRQVLPIGGFDEIPLDVHQREKLHLPLKFSNSKGLITNIVFDGREKAWSANIKRGILHMIQVNLQKKTQSTSVDVVDIVEDEYMNTYKPTERDASFYRTMEETIEGQCETMYTVTKPQIFKSARDEVFNVTKTVNFEKCIKRPQIKYNFHFSEPCPTCESKYTEDQKFLKSSSISSYQVVKTPKFNVINNAYTESEYVFTPLNEEANSIVTYVSQNLKLIKTGVALNRVQGPLEPKKSDSDMIYTLDKEISRETFQMEGNSKELEKTLLYKGQQNKIQIAKNLLLKLTNNIREQVEEPATKHFQQLVNLLRLMSKTEIEQLHNVVANRAALSLSSTQFSHQEQQRAKELLHDAIGVAGTKSCVKHLVEKIKQHEIPIVKAVSSIKNLMVMRTPSKEIIEELIKLAESPVAERHYFLKQAAWLTIGTLMKSLCANHEDQWAREFKESIHKFCPKTLKQEYVKILVKKLHSTHKWDEKLIFVKALGNAGIDLSVFEIEKIIYNKNFNHRTLVRSEAVLALRKLKTVMPKKIQKVLMPLVSNKMEPQTLRITAAYMILQTLPNRPVLDQLAKLVQNERSIQVSSFIFSYMDNLANSTNPCERKLATDLRLSLRQTHKIYSRVLGNSKFCRIPMHSQHQKVGLDLDLASTFAEGRNVPRELAATLHSNFLGFWNKYLVSFRLATEGLDKVLRRAYNKFGNMEEFNGDSIFGNEFEDMFSQSGIFGQEVHDVRSKDPKAVFTLKIKNQDVGFLPIKRHAIESILHGRPTGNVQAIVNKLRHGITVNYNKATYLDEITYKIPTTIGMPVFVNIKVPVVINVHGAIKMTPLGGAIQGDLHKFQIKAVLKPSLVASVIVDVACWSPIVVSGVNVVSKVKAFKPIDAKLVADLKSETKIVKLLFKPPTQRKDLITLESKPSTFTLIKPKQMMSYESKQKRLILGEEGQRARTIHECNTCSWLGVRFCVKGRYHKTPNNKLTNAPFAPLAGPNKIVISTEPSVATPHTIAINIFGKFLKPVSISNIQSTLPSAQRNFLNIISNDYSSYSNTLESTQILGAGVNNLMAESTLFNTAPTVDPSLKHKQVKRPLLNSLRIKVEAPQRYTTLDFVHIFNLDGDYHKVQAKVHRSPVPEHPQPWKMCLNAETIFPTLKLIENLPNGEVLGKLSLRWGQSCNSPKFIHVVKRLEKHYSPKTYELENPEWRVQKDSNMFHDELLKKSPIKYIFDIKYQNVPLKAKHYGNELLRYIKNEYYDQTNVAEVAVYNKPQQIKVIVAIDPVTLKKCDVLIKTPKSNVLIRDLTLPSYVRPITHKHDYLKNEQKSLTRETLFAPHTAQCYASELNVKTFHDRELPLPLSHSYKVLAKDCKTNQYTILVRQITEIPQLKEVKIITEGNEITLKPSLTRKDKTKVFVNGKDQTLQNDIVKTVAGVPVLRIIRQSSHVKVEILTAGVSVYFDRKSVNIEVPPHKRNGQCGICGTNSFSGLKTEFPIHFSESPFVNEIENELYGVEYNSENILDKTTGLYSGLSDITGSFSLGSSLRDYSTVDDVLGHYFNYRPMQNIWGNEDLVDEDIYNNQPFGNNQDSIFDGEFDFEKLNQNKQGWSRPAEREWEIEQLVSNSNPNPQYENLHDLEKINSEFDRYYSPVSNIEREIESNWMDEQIFTPYSTNNQAFPSFGGELIQEEYLSNPYLNKNYVINDQACKYLPFWERKVKGCNDIFSTVFDEQEQFAQIANAGYNGDYDNVNEFAYDIQSPINNLNEWAYDNESPINNLNEIMYENQSPINQLVQNEIIRNEVAEQEYSTFGIRSELTNEIYENNMQQSNQFEQYPTNGRKQKVVETEHSICFSLIPVKCHHKAYPKDGVKQTVPYHCMSRQNPLAQKYHNEILAGRSFIPTLQSMTPTMTRVEVVPVRCQPIF